MQRPTFVASDAPLRYELTSANGRFDIVSVPLPEIPLTSDQVEVRIIAVSLNYRDLLVVDGVYPGVSEGLSPLSDAAGIVTAVGDGVTRWKVGDRVSPTFMPAWSEGPFARHHRASALGGEADGVLSQRLVIGEHALVAIPDSLEFAEAAALPCAGVTAWHALVERGGFGKGKTLLVQGTGGVALFGLQIAKALGGRVILTSSSDAKIERARALGADETINYRTHPEWHEQALELTNGGGVDHILELGGPDTFASSIACLAPGGVISQIGVLTGFGSQPLLGPVQGLNAEIHGVTVGSRQHYEALAAFIDLHQIRPVIDARFPVSQISEAFDLMRGGGHFGKIIVEL